MHRSHLDRWLTRHVRRSCSTSTPSVPRGDLITGLHNWITARRLRNVRLQAKHIFFIFFNKTQKRSTCQKFENVVQPVLRFPRHSRREQKFCNILYRYSTKKRITPPRGSPLLHPPLEIFLSTSLSRLQVPETCQGACEEPPILVSVGGGGVMGR